MTDLAPVEAPAESRHMAALPPKRRALVDAIVHGGKPFKEAVQVAGFSHNRALEALRDPTVRQAIAAEMQVLRSSIRPRMLHRAVEIAEQDENRGAAITAIKHIAGDGEQARAAININITPGYVIDLTAEQAARKPLIEHVVDEVIRIDGAQGGGGSED